MRSPAHGRLVPVLRRRGFRAAQIALLLTSAILWPRRALAGQPSTADVTAVAHDYFVPPRSASTATEPDPPRYTRPLDRTGLPGTTGLDWVDVGLDYRTRVEFRNGDLRRPDADALDTPLLLRTRLFVGVRPPRGPFRFTLELHDSRRYVSRYALDSRDVNAIEPVQATVEVQLSDALGRGRPVVARAGRFTIEVLDRRLATRNEWRNTTNSFQGARVTLGQRHQAWSAELFAAQPVRRRLTSIDRADGETWFTGAVGTWRRWSTHATLEPYYLGLTQGSGANARQIHTTGLRAFGPAGTHGLDYDMSVHRQFGHDGAEAHRAWAATGEVGVRFDRVWQPRVAVFYGIADGDRTPGDGESNRFDRLYGFSRPWSSSDYIQMENVSSPKAVVELTPARGLAIDAAYAAYWLTSATDRWAGVGLRDPSGSSGRFAGQEFNIRARYPVTPHLGANVGYAGFVPGEFPRRLGRAEVTHFFYVELTVNAFR